MPGPVAPPPLRHLWEYEHPFAFRCEEPYRQDGGGTHDLPSLAALRDRLARDLPDAPADSTYDWGRITARDAVVYRWDWLPEDPEAEQHEQLVVTFGDLPRGRTLQYACPVDPSQESEVVEFLRGPRALGALRTLWSPLLDEPGRPHGHLWEHPHPWPTYNDPADGGVTSRRSFHDLRDHLDKRRSEGAYSAVIYRWDWLHDSPTTPTLQFPEELVITCGSLRKSLTYQYVCPVDPSQESEVLEFLRGPRVLGTLRLLWEPLLGEPDPAAIETLRFLIDGN